MKNYIVVEEVDDCYGNYDELKDMTVYHSIKEIKAKYSPIIKKYPYLHFDVYEIAKNQLIEQDPLNIRTIV